ncbi:hypothetical protein UIS_02609 [Enterococcus faecium EnGen0313]|nr:hypothetical protein UIS_02609 [Enterococcus faecium EnGen0313]
MTYLCLKVQILVLQWGNSHQEIMKKADYVTVSNDKDGVSQAFEIILTI